MAQTKEKIYINPIMIWEDKPNDKGWTPQWTMAIKPEELTEALLKLPRDKYGSIKLRVSKMKEPNAKSKTTHYVYYPVPEDANYPYPKDDNDGF